MTRLSASLSARALIGLAWPGGWRRPAREVILLEAAEGIGTATSSRNSEVIHAGIYYKAGSLMAQMCVGGKAGALSILPGSTASRIAIAAS